MSTLDEVVARIRTDAEFRESVRRTPGEALAPYELGDGVRTAFADPEMLALWTAVVGETAVTWASFPVAIYAGPPPAPPAPPAPPVALPEPPAPPVALAEPPAPPAPPVTPPEPPAPPVPDLWVAAGRRAGTD